MPIAGDTGKLSESWIPPAIFVGSVIQGLWSKSPNPAYAIADGTVALFSDYPLLKQAYDEGYLRIGGTRGFSLYGTTGVTLPNLNGLFVQATTAAVAGDYTSAGLPNIIGKIGPLDDRTQDNLSGLFYYGRAWNYDATSTGNSGGFVAYLDASRCSSIYGNSSTVMPESVKLLTCIYLGKHA